MNDKMAERVLAIPTPVFHRAGVFQGFCADVAYYLPLLLMAENLVYLPRADAETDPTHKQLIPYVVLQWRDQVFAYARGKRATETRLQTLRSIGVGGHICADDNTLFESPYREAMFREVSEEVRLDTVFRERCIGLINDDSTAVGQVHLGIVHVFELEEPRVEKREQALTQAGFAPIASLRGQKAAFEPWSQFVLDVLI